MPGNRCKYVKAGSTHPYTPKRYGLRNIVRKPSDVELFSGKKSIKKRQEQKSLTKSERKRRKYTKSTDTSYTRYSLRSTVRKAQNVDSDFMKQLTSEPYIRVGSDKPEKVCFSSSVMCYVDQRFTPRQIYWVDCSTIQPKPFANGPRVTHTNLSDVEDMSCVVRIYKLRLLLVCSSDTIEAYDATHDKLLWKFCGKLPGAEKDIQPIGIDTNGEDTVFVCDKANACVHMFTLQDGCYSGRLIMKGQEIGAPLAIKYEYSRTSGESLFIVNEKDKSEYLHEVALRAPVFTSRHCEPIYNQNTLPHILD